MRHTCVCLQRYGPYDVIGYPRWLRVVGGPRRVLGAVLAAVVVAQLGRAATAAPPPSVTVVVAARDLPAGLAVTDDDVRTVTRPSSDVPAGALDDPVGQVPSAPVAEGEPLLGTRTQPADSLLRVPVRLDDGGVAELVAVGDRVDVLAAPVASTDDAPFARAATVIADDLLVDRVVTGEAGDGVLLEVRATRSQAQALAGAATTGRLSVAVHAPGS